MEPTGAAPLRPDDPAEIGTYRLLGRLGEGGMGTVYLAVADTRLVALKVVRSTLADDAFAARLPRRGRERAQGGVVLHGPGPRQREHG